MRPQATAFISLKPSARRIAVADMPLAHMASSRALMAALPPGVCPCAIRV